MRKVFALVAAAAAFAPQEPQRPAFRAGVGLVAVDVAVSDRNGRPLEGLTASEFRVWIDGREGAVKTAAFVRTSAAEAAVEAGKPSAPAAAATPPAAPAVAEPRTVVLAIDQPSFRVANEAAALEAANRLIARLPSEDLLGLVAYPAPGVSIAPTRDRDAIRRGLKQFGGRLQVVRDPQIHISLTEAMAVGAQDAIVTREVIQRECAPSGPPRCPTLVQQVAQEMASRAEGQASSSLNGLHSVIDAMKGLPGRTILVVVSAGLPLAPRGGPMGDVSTMAMGVGRAAAAANITMYTLFMDATFLNAFSALNTAKEPHRELDDAQLLSFGLESVSNAAGGTLFRVEVGPHTAIERVLRETSAYYLLGVEPRDADRDNRSHTIRVAVSRRGAVVRSRTSAVIPVK